MDEMEASDADEIQTIVLLAVAHEPLACHNGERPVLGMALGGLRYVNGGVFNPKSVGCARPETLGQSTDDVWQARLVPSTTIPELRARTPFQTSFAMVEAVAGTIGGAYDGNPLASSLEFAADVAALA